MILLSALMACTPAWWQPTEWQGDDTTAIGVLCDGSTILESAPEPYWVRVSVRWHDEVRVDWGSATLAGEHIEVEGNELGTVRVAGRDQSMRYHNFWVRPKDVEPGDVLDIGPYTVQWQSRDANAPRELVGGACSVTVQR